MKLSILAASLLSALAIAAPEAQKGYGHKGGKGKWGGRKFTSTYSVVATPKQVVNETESGRIVYTGGLPVSIFLLHHCETLIDQP